MTYHTFTQNESLFWSVFFFFFLHLTVQFALKTVRTHNSRQMGHFLFCPWGINITYMVCPHACLHTHEWMREEPGGLVWGLEWRADKKIKRRIKGDGSYIFRSSSSRDVGLLILKGLHRTHAQPIDIHCLNGNKRARLNHSGGHRRRGLPNQTYIHSLYSTPESLFFFPFIG